MGARIGTSWGTPLETEYTPQESGFYTNPPGRRSFFFTPLDLHAKRSTSFIESYTRNTFLIFVYAPNLHHCANTEAPIEKSHRQKCHTGHSFKMMGCMSLLSSLFDITFLTDDMKHSVVLESTSVNRGNMRSEKLKCGSANAVEYSLHFWLSICTPSCMRGCSPTFSGYGT